MLPDPSPPRVGRAARLLGGAGLLPQLGAVVLAARAGEAGRIIAFGYAGLILSFLGGIWWGFAMRRPAERGGQGRLAALAIIPSLVPAALAMASVVAGWRWALAGLAAALLLTLLVDRQLADAGEAPAGWLGLRVPLSAGLALLTLVAAVLR